MITVYTSLWDNLSQESKNLGYYCTIWSRLSKDGDILRVLSLTKDIYISNGSKDIYIWAIFLLSSHFCGTTSQNCSKFWYVVKHKKVSLQKNFQPPPPPFVCGAYLNVQNNPFFRVFYLFSNAHYSKQN